MPRKLLTLVLSSLFLGTSAVAHAAPFVAPMTPAQTTTAQSAPRTANTSPLPPGPARIKPAQGLEDDDLGPGVIIAGAAVITGLLFWMMADDDDDDDEGPPTTGTN
jgi:hypothetical protein